MAMGYWMDSKMKNKKKNRLTLIALEPRLVFDGAGAATEALIDPTSREAATADTPTEASADTVTVELPEALSHPASNRQEVVVIDGGLDNLQILLQDIAAADPQRLIVVLDPSQDEVSQLIAFLQQHSGQFDAIHVLSHGGKGWISLGDQTIVLGEPEAHEALWAVIKETLTAEGDLLLYGCEIAADTASQTAVTQLAQLTGADIAASTNITGVDGDWTLEYRSGSVEAVDIAAPNWAGNLWLTEALQASWWSDDAGNRNLVTTAVPSSLTFSNMAAGPGVALGFYQFGSATTFKISNVDSTTKTGSIAANEYIKTTFSIKPGLTNGYALSKLKFRAYSSPASAYMSIALYDTTTASLTTVSPMDLSLLSNLNGSLIWNVGLDKVPVIAGRTYELRMYVWGGGSYKTVYIDQPQVYAVENQFPVARADTFSATAGTALSGNLVSANNGAGADTDPEAQALSVTRINGAAYTVGSNIALAKGTLSITNANGAFTFTPAAGASGSQTFTYTIIDGVGGSATATATVNITVPVNDPPLSVNHVAVNEGSPFVVSEVTGVAGQMVKLFMGHTATGLGHAVIGTDTQNANGSFQMQYFNGTAWTDYTADSFVAIPNNTSNKLLVRTRIVNDGVYEGMERYFLMATSQVSASNSSTAGVYIYDDGTGQYFPDNTTGATDPTAVLDDDRPSFSVNDVSVNESAGTMTFTVTKTGTTALSSTVNYTIGDVTTTGAADYSAGTSALSGTLTFAAGVTTQTVTINIVNDTLHEPTDTLNIVLSGATGATIADATGVGTIVDNDARVPVPVSVSSVTVNEKSSYAVFTVSAEPGSVLDLSTSPGTATAGSMMSAGDYANSIQFWNGSAWITTTVFNATPTADANGTLKVRVGITDDSTGDNGETFTLQATYRNNATNTTLGVAIGSSATGTGTIVDDGSGLYWNSNVDPLTPSTDPVVGPTIDPLRPLADDDRAITIDDQTVNEASPYAVQTVTGNTGQYVRLELGVTGNGAGHALAGSDFTQALEYWNGSAWTAYTAGTYVKMPAATMQVRVPILNDSALENNETYQVTVYNTGGTADVGTVTIADDGSGKKWSFSGPNDPGSAPAVGPGPGFDDERALTITGFTVNEKSPYGVFTVAGVAGQYVTLSCADGTATGGVDYSTSLQYLNGSTWQTYTAGSHVQVQSDGLLRVRTAIVDDTVYEMSESLTLTAANTSAMAVTATGTILDDGQGDYFGANDPTPNANPPTPLDDDRPRNPAFVDDLIVNEGSPIVVFSVTGVPTAGVTLSLSDGTALAGVDYTNSLQYWNGSAWAAYNSSTPPALDNNGKLLVRAPVLQDNSNEPDESLQLSVQYTGTRNSGVTSLVPDTSNSFTGTAWIVDDGNGTFFPEATPNNNTLPPVSPYNPATDPVVGPTLDPTRPLPDDDRTVTVNDITVNEASPYAVFTVNGFEGQYVKLVLGTGTATAGTDYTAALEYWSGTAWTSYTAGSYVKVPADADSTAGEAANLLVRVAITDDNTPDNGENFTLTTYNTGGGSDVSTCTIVDDGTGKIFPNLNPATPSNPGSPLTPQELTPASDPVVGPTIDPTRPLPDDDRSVTVNDITVNEASPYAVFTVSGYEGQYVKLVLGTGTATAGTDYTAALEYWNGTAWTSYTAGSYVKVPADADSTAGEAANLLVRVAITNDNTPDNGETFTLTAYNTGGGSDVSTCTIVDDGTGKIFPNLNPATPSNPGSPVTPQELTPASDPVVGPTIDPTRPLPDDERTLQVTGFTVNEASPYGIFTVTGVANQYVRLNVTDGTAKVDANGTPLTDGTEDYGPQLQFYDATSSSWVNYAAGSYVKIPASGSTLLVRTAIINDVKYEMSESFMLTATSSGGSSASDVASIRDDGQGDYFGGGNSSGTPDAPPGALDDDRPKNPAFVSDVLISEGSPYAVFHVSGAPTAQMTLTLAGDTAEMGTDFNNALQVFVNSAWVAYNGTNAVLNNRGDLMVRTTLNNQQAYEGIEYFKLNAAYTGTWDSTAFPNLNPDTTRVFSGRAGIVDDGTGVIFRADDPATVGNESAPTVIADDVSTAGLDEYAMFMDTVTPTFANVVDPATSPDPLADDDRTVTVNDITVNEASPYAVFTVNGYEGQYVKLVLGTGTATAGTDYTAALEYWNGTAWTSYTAGSYVKVPADADSTAGEAANLLVRVAITDDSTPDNGETFTLTAYNTGGGSDVSTCTIVDDGSGKFFPNLNPVTPSNPGSPLSPQELTPASEPVVGPTLDPNRPLPDDDRAVTIDDITVNEASPYAVFTVEGREGQYIQLDLAQGTATAGVDYAQAIEYWNGNTWVRYTPGSYIQLPTDGDNVKAENASLKVRVTITNDTFVDNGETFSLVATNTGGTSVHGLATLFEDDTGNISNANANSNLNLNLTPHTAKDDDPRNVGTAPAAPILATAQDFSPWATEPLAAPPAQVHVQTAVQQTRLVTMDLPVADALIDKFDRQTDPHLYVLPAVWSSRVRMHESVMATQALHSGWLNQIDALTNPSGLFMLQALAQDPAVPTLADQTLAQMREEAQGLPPALESPHTPQVAAEEAPPTPKPLQRGALSFSQQLQQTATQRRASASV